MELVTKIAIALLSTSAAVDAFSSISQSKTARVTHINLYSYSRDLDAKQSITDGKIDKQSKIQRIQQFGLATWERMDTMKAAGLTNDPELVPMNAGFKTNVGLLVGAFLFKWYRARFVTKVCDLCYCCVVIATIYPPTTIPSPCMIADALHSFGFPSLDSSLGQTTSMEHSCYLTRTRKRTPCL